MFKCKCLSLKPDARTNQEIFYRGQIFLDSFFAGSSLGLFQANQQLFGISGTKPSFLHIQLMLVLLGLDLFELFGIGFLPLQIHHFSKLVDQEGSEFFHQEESFWIIQLK